MPSGPCKDTRSMLVHVGTLATMPSVRKMLLRRGRGGRGRREERGGDQKRREGGRANETVVRPSRYRLHGSYRDQTVTDERYSISVTRRQRGCDVGYGSYRAGRLQGLDVAVHETDGVDVLQTLPPARDAAGPRRRRQHATRACAALASPRAAIGSESPHRHHLYPLVVHYILQCFLLIHLKLLHLKRHPSRDLAVTAFLPMPRSMLSHATTAPACSHRRVYSNLQPCTY